MPQIDFGQIFGPENQTHLTPGQEPHAPFTSPPPISGQEKRPAAYRDTGLVRSDWTNILFVVVSIFSGLFCAFYFFNGTELLRVAGTWPGEFLYSRPANPSPPDDANSNFLADSTWPESPFDADENSDDRPFRRNGGLNSLNPLPPRPARSTAATNSNSSAPGIPTLSPPSIPGTNPGPGSLPGRLAGPLQAGDRLMQAFDKGVADLQRATQLLRAPRTVTIIQTRVSQTGKRATKLTRQATRSLGNSAVARATGRVISRSAQISQRTTGSVNIAQNRARGSTHSTANSVQTGPAHGGPLGGLGRAGFRSGGMGGLGGIGSGRGGLGGLGGGRGGGGGGRH